MTLLSRKDRGSLFAFDLQPGAPADAARHRTHRTGSRRRDLSGTLVVVVDDEELILDAARTLLAQWNCSVVAATSGHDALRQLADSLRPPDVLICDYRLRDNETGIGVVEAIRNEFNTEIPALLVSGDTDPGPDPPDQRERPRPASQAAPGRRAARRDLRAQQAARAGSAELGSGLFFAQESRRAACIAWVRFATPSTRNTEETCIFTVTSATSSRSPISLFGR